MKTEMQKLRMMEVRLEMNNAAKIQQTKTKQKCRIVMNGGARS